MSLFSSRQRISARSIQEKMERLAQASQVSETKLSTVTVCGDNTKTIIAYLHFCLCACVRAWQKLEPSRPMDVAHRTLHRLDKVSMKRGIFEKDSQAATPTSPRPSRHVKHSASICSFDHLTCQPASAFATAVLILLYFVLPGN